MKTKVIRNIEEKLQELDPDSIRYQVLDNAKKFKTSWITLGQMLYSVWKDKLYKEWGYSDLDAYTSREIGIRKQTALKLLRSYSFLETKEPRYVQNDYNEQAETASIPSYDAVDVLRQASKKDLDRGDYARIRKYVLEDGKDAREVKKDLTDMMKQREELEPEDARREKRQKVLKRFVSSLKSLSKEIRISKLLPEKIAKEAEKVVEMIENEY